METSEMLSALEKMERAIAKWTLARDHLRSARNEIEQAVFFLRALGEDEENVVGFAAMGRVKELLRLLDGKIMCHWPYVEQKIGRELYGLKPLPKRGEK